MVAAIELLVKLVGWITKLFEAIFPEAHMLEIAECFLIRLYPIRTENNRRGEKYNTLAFIILLYTKSG